jgi:hypothetical protein
MARPRSVIEGVRSRQANASDAVPLGEGEDVNELPDRIAESQPFGDLLGVDPRARLKKISRGIAISFAASDAQQDRARR